MSKVKNQNWKVGDRAWAGRLHSLVIVLQVLDSGKLYVEDFGDSRHIVSPQHLSAAN